MANDRRNMFTFPTKAALDTYVAGKALKGVYTVDIDETHSTCVQSIDGMVHL